MQIKRSWWRRGGKFAALAALIAWASGPARAENWPHWRGPAFNGASTEKNLPAQWTQTSGVKWAVPMPGVSAATPIIWDNLVFATAAVKDGPKLMALALDRATGKILWQQQVGNEYAKDDRSTYASPSPVTDGKRVWFFFGNGDLAGYDLKGQQLWHRNIQKDYGQFAFGWTFSSTPLLFNGKLYVQVLQRDVPVHGHGRTDGPNESYLLALDPETGKELWRALRPSEAVAESREAFSSPIPLLGGKRAEILLVGGDVISGHNPDNGAELWRWGNWNPTRVGDWRLVPSPVAAAGVALACAPKNGHVYAVKLGGNGKLTDANLAWTSQEREFTADVSTPLFYEGSFYVLNTTKHLLLRVEPATGKVIWQGDLGGRAVFESSPTGADGKIYAMNHNGDVMVVQAGGTEFKLLATIPMDNAPMTKGKFNRGSIAISQGCLFIRTLEKLYCIGK